MLNGTPKTKSILLNFPPDEPEDSVIVIVQSPFGSIPLKAEKSS